jgi:hypothetical protein
VVFFVRRRTFYCRIVVFDIPKIILDHLKEFYTLGALYLVMEIQDLNAVKGFSNIRKKFKYEHLFLSRRMVL